MIIAIDFDGTITGYNGFKGVDNYYDVLPGASLVTKQLKEDGHTIIINTCRGEKDNIKEFLDKNGVVYDHINYNPVNDELNLSKTKLFADIYIDDRGLKFNGSWVEMYKEILRFKPWWENKKEEKDEV